MKGDFIRVSNGQFQIRYPSYMKPTIVDYMDKFESKLAKRSFLIPSTIANNPLEWNSLICLVDDFIRKHTFTVWYEVHGNKSSVTLAGYVAVINMIEENVIKRFLKSEASKKTTTNNTAAAKVENKKTNGFK